MLSMSKGKFQAVCSRYASLLILSNDAEEALSFAQELLEAEADEVKKYEPTATTTISRLEAAAQELFELRSAIAAEEFKDFAKK